MSALPGQTLATILALCQRVQALAAYKQSKAIAEKLAASDPGNAEWQRDIAVSNMRFGAWHRDGGEKAAARAAFASARAISVRLLAIDPGNAIWKNDLAWLDRQLAGLE